MKKEELEQRIQYAREVVLHYLPKAEGLQKTVLSAMEYSVGAGGKRVRPVLMLETYRMFGGSEKVIEPFMAAIEMIHTYSLVHDDLPAMDNDDYRRGQPTTHKKYGEDMGILTGDALLNYAFEVMLSAGDSQTEAKRLLLASRIIAQKAGIFGMIGGQVADVELTGKPVNEEQLDFIFKLKTGALIEAAFMTGAVLAGAKEACVDACEQAGRHVGMAFQIQDDILDVTAAPQVLGKPVFSDERNNKTTYVTLYGMDKAMADVEYHSMEAVAVLEKLGTNPFLMEYITYLIRREK